MKGLTEGRIVHYVMNEGRYPGQHRPAIVVRVWRDHEGNPPANGVCQLQVFVDGTNDDPFFTNGMGTMWRTSVVNDEDEKKPGTWHWIEAA